MRISPRFTTEHWKAIDFNTEEGWQKAVTILDDRIRGRFFVPIRLIEDEYGAGFAILALHSLLIETLQQFREGTIDTPRRKGEEYFINFLTGTCLKKYFDDELAKQFYQVIRCGILHQGEVKGNSVVRCDVPLVQHTKDKKGLKVNRRRLNSKLEAAFDEYLNQLRNPANLELRSRFRNKMNHICRVP
jgi:hypothetical protein